MCGLGSGLPRDRRGIPAALAMPADVTDIEINPLLAQVDGAKALDALVLFAAD